MYGHVPGSAAVIGARWGSEVVRNPSNALFGPTPPGREGALNAVSLAQAFQTRMAALSSVAASLLGKREGISHQVWKELLCLLSLASCEYFLGAATADRFTLSCRLCSRLVNV